METIRLGGWFFFILAKTNPTMQTKSATDKGRQLASSFLFLSMFPTAVNPTKYSWVILPAAIMMLYFNFKKYKEEKQAGIKHSKFGFISIMLLISILVIIAASISNYLISIGYYD
ncbi:hypothetical protein [Flavobacterium sp. AG291]|uniref:hypothetical protein n=1 Tax=Flavobacterium sp. AG291 TaxID=2184000 RepID=UPI0011C04470|nr:hypothetical protein [Flavobacterium sp. AG291]